MVETQSAVGIYFGDKNCYNISYLLDSAFDRHKSQATEPWPAFVTEIKRAWVRRADAGENLPLNQLVSKSDSEYLVRGITDWISKWKNNGWLYCKRQPVAKAPLFKLIELYIGRLERGKKVVVKFWMVPRAQNKEANCLAKMALMKHSTRQRTLGD
ncbi:hypothetical protein NUU61_006983 [Penicillium alfredii]|uniref:RNase H type-1 domain-containing protein n=1 Tax=Penicillium alfredii TaxID=1506179 RepID=A0A9W9K3U3_9EURO|nr:uncharacterized protein NUU61_006983 [Penicillium alfredii]KAJ5092113.1 hypothetical protein NUU61_006983 [Penicillium alfredii]